jgi:hypothetical protein
MLWIFKNIKKPLCQKAAFCFISLVFAEEIFVFNSGTQLSLRSTGLPCLEKLLPVYPSHRLGIW